MDAIFYGVRTSEARIEPFDTHSKRICATRMHTNLCKLLFVNVYLPYEDGDRESDEFYSQLVFIEKIINENCDSHIILGGDFNVGFNRKSCNTDALVIFCQGLSLTPDISHPDYCSDL